MPEAHGALTPYRTEKALKSWAPVVRNYPHFDPLITPEKAMLVATSPRAVATHTFYPFIKYVERWTLFADAGEVGNHHGKASPGRR